MKLILPNDKTKPLRLFFSDWTNTIGTLNQEIEQIGNLFLNGFVDPTEIKITYDKKIITIHPIKKGMVINGRFIIIEKPLMYQVQGNNRSGIYTLSFELKKSVKREVYQNDPFHDYHEYEHEELGFTISYFGENDKLKYHKNLLFISFFTLRNNSIFHFLVYIQGNKIPDKVRFIGTPEYQAPKVGSLEMSYHKDQFSKGVLYCDGSSVSVSSYPILFEKLTDKYGSMEYSETKTKFKFVGSPFYKEKDVFVVATTSLESYQSYPYFSFKVDDRQNYYFNFKVNPVYVDNRYSQSRNEYVYILEQLTIQTVFAIRIRTYISRTSKGYLFFPFEEQRDLLEIRTFKLPKIESNNGIFYGITSDEILKEPLSIIE